MAATKISSTPVVIEQVDTSSVVPNRRRENQDDELSPLLERRSTNFDVSDSEFDILPWHQKPSVYWLLVPFALSALAHGGTIVPRVNLFLSLICQDYLRNHGSVGKPFIGLISEPGPECRVPEVQQAVATFKMPMGIISGVLAALIAPRLGSFSDQYGRIKMLAYIHTGSIIHELITILCARFPDWINYRWILLGAFFDGISGSHIAALAISHSYASDCTPASQRNVVFGYFHGFFFTGIAMGPILAGYIIKTTGDIISMFYIAGFFHFVFLTMLIFVIPESVPKSNQVQAREKFRREHDSHGEPNWKHMMRNINLFKPLKILYDSSLAPELRRNLILLAATDTIVFGVGMGANQIVLLYSNYVFGWSQWEQAKFTSIVNCCRVANLVFLLPIVSKIYRRYYDTGDSGGITPNPGNLEGTDRFELAVIRLAIFADAMGFLSYAMSKSGPAFILSGAITSIGGIGSPTMQAALTKHVPKDAIGQLLGAMGLLHAMARVIGPTLFTGVYALTVKFLPQAYFFILTAMFALAFGVSWLIKPGRWRHIDPRYQD